MYSTFPILVKRGQITNEPQKFKVIDLPFQETAVASVHKESVNQDTGMITSDKECIFKWKLTFFVCIS